MVGWWGRAAWETRLRNEGGELTAVFKNKTQHKNVRRHAMHGRQVFLEQPKGSQNPSPPSKPGTAHCYQGQLVCLSPENASSCLRAAAMFPCYHDKEGFVVSCE